LRLPGDKGKGAPVTRKQVRPLRWLCDHAKFRAQLDRRRELAARPNNGVHVVTTHSGELSMATETSEKRALALVTHFERLGATPESPRGKGESAEVGRYVEAHPENTGLAARWRAVQATWART